MDLYCYVVLSYAARVRITHARSAQGKQTAVLPEVAEFRQSGFFWPLCGAKILAWRNPPNH